jgi:hypothetical protein
MLQIADVPDVDAPPARRARSEVVRDLRRLEVSRRSVLRGAVTSAMAASLATVGQLPTARRAVAGPNTVYSSWSNCSYYFSNPTEICSPTSDLIHASYCNNVGYHRDDSSKIGCYYRNYDVRFACNTRNAWHWAAARKRCSDGSVYVNDCGDTWRTNTICRASY